MGNEDAGREGRACRGRCLQIINLQSGIRMSEDPWETLGVYLDASYPVLLVPTREELRVEQALLDMTNASNNDAAQQGESETFLFRWSDTEGLMRMTAGLEAIVLEDASPVGVLEWLAKQTTHSVLILRDFMNFLNGNQAYFLQRTLKDVVQAASAQSLRKTIVVIDTDEKIPDRLENLVTIVDWPVPSKEEICELIKAKVDVHDEYTAEEIDRAAQAALGLTLTEVEQACLRAVVSTGRLDAATVVGEKKQAIRRGGLLEFYSTDSGLESLGGMAGLKVWLRDRESALSPEAEAYGLDPLKGILLVGIPGTGKSLAAKLIGSIWNLPTLRMDFGALFGQYIGQSEGQMRKALKLAEALAPCVLWVDELEKSMGGMSGGGGDSGTSKRVLSTWLTWMQDRKAPVFVAATANDVRSLPPEVTRQGRFDAMFFVDLPNEQDREEIFAIHLQKRKRERNDYDLTRLSEATDRFTGAEIESVVTSAMYSAFPEKLTTDHLLSAVKGTTILADTQRESIERLRKWGQANAIIANKVANKGTARPPILSASNAKKGPKVVRRRK